MSTVRSTFLSPPTQRSRGLFIAGIAVGALAVAGFGVWWTRAKAPQAPILKYLTYSGHDYSPAASPDGKTIAFTSDRDGRPRIWLKDLASGRETALTTGPDDYARFAPDGSTILFSRTVGSLTSLYKMPIAGGAEAKVVDDALDGDWSPDGRRIAFVRSSSRGPLLSAAIWTIGADAQGAAELAQSLNGSLKQPRWSPDGRTIAAVQSFIQAGSPTAIFVVDAASGRSRTIGATSGGFAILSIAWNGSGDDLLYSQAESVSLNGAAGRIVEQNLVSGGTQTLFWSPYAGLIFDVAGPGTIVFGTGSPRQNVREVAVRGGSAKGRWLTRGNSTDRQPAYSPDGEWVIFSSNQSGNLDLWEVSTKTGSSHRITDDPAEDWDPSFTADGKQIVWSSNRSGHFEVWIAGADGSGARQLTQDGVDAENPTVTPDGNWIVYSSGNPAKNGVWKVRKDGSQATRLVAGPTLVPDVSPDGQYCLYVPNVSGKPYQVKVLRLADASAVPFEILGDVFPRSRWMPDGKAIAFIGQDEKGVRGVFVQDFAAGQDTAKTRRPLGGFDADSTAESFGIASDGMRMAMAAREQLSSLMMAERVPAVVAQRR
jgi:eukaryotic-like serine/threonine-protein kinase